MNEEQGSGKNWSRVAQIYERVANERNPSGANGRGNSEILQAVDSNLPFSEASYILDMGCGPGQVTSGILSSGKHASQIPDDARFVAADLSQAFVDMMSKRKEKNVSEGEKQWEKVEVKLWDAKKLSEVKDGEVSHIVAGYCYVAMQNETDGLKEALRVLKPGGLIVMTSLGDTDWARLPGFVQDVRPEKSIPPLGEGAQSWWNAESVKGKLTNVGFKDVGAREYECFLEVDRYDDAIEFVFEGFPFMKGTVEDMSEEEVEKVKELMREFLRGKYPEEPLALEGRGVVAWGRK